MKLAKQQKRVDYDKMTDDQILEIYKQVYPERSEQNLKEYVYYQRIIHDAKTKKGKEKNQNIREEVVEDEE